ncbi:MAG: hypothetical protein EHM55_18695 [Acidobacteria bacterium]|nr:MAG: hypothetical protein EHM55_18695 [Acidobacteriota bacterium]
MNKGDTFHMRAVLRSSMTGAGLAVLLLGSVSCGDVARTGRSPSLLVIESLQGASGADPEVFSAFLLSDVQTLVDQTIDGEEVQVPTIFNDIGQAALRVELKDRGLSGTGGTIAPLNQVTLSRYRIVYRRADGRNTPGVDVPFGTDGAVTATIGESPVTVSFEIVRHQAKLELPLRSLVNLGGRLFISTFADVTFFGSDLAGNEVQVTGTMSVSFSDYADPE